MGGTSVGRADMRPVVVGGEVVVPDIDECRSACWRAAIEMTVSDGMVLP